MWTKVKSHYLSYVEKTAIVLGRQIVLLQRSGLWILSQGFFRYIFFSSLLLNSSKWIYLSMIWFHFSLSSVWVPMTSVLIRYRNKQSCMPQYRCHGIYIVRDWNCIHWQPMVCDAVYSEQWTWTQGKSSLSLTREFAWIFFLTSRTQNFFFFLKKATV